MVLLLYLKTNKIKYQFMLSINLLKSKSKYTHPYTILHHITDWPEQSWSFPWLRADYFLRLSFLNRCDLYFILVFRRKSSNSNFFQRWEPWFVSRYSFQCFIFYCILAYLETFFKCVNNTCPSLFLGLNSCFSFILDSFRIYLSKITVSVIQWHVVYR